MHERVCLPMNCVPPSVHILIPVSQIEFLEVIFIGKVLKVSRKGKLCVFNQQATATKASFNEKFRCSSRFLKDGSLVDVVTHASHASSVS